MVITHYANTREAPAAPLSPGFEQAEDTEEDLFSVTVPNETSALLPDGGRVLVSQRSGITGWGQSAISSFLDKNVGLVLVASSQFFFAASNICVKWLNSLDESERVPILEARHILEGKLILKADDFKCKS
jgi:hypothetical protein